MNKPSPKNIQKTILSLLESAGAHDIDHGLSPKQLITGCAREGLTDVAKIEESLVDLIDTDQVEYDMDENDDVSKLWLLDPENMA